MVAFTKNDKQVYHSFVYLVDVTKLLSGTNFVCGTFENLFVSAKKLSSRDKISVLVKC